MPKAKPQKKIDTVDALKRSARSGLQVSAAMLLIVQGVNLFGPRELSLQETQWIIAAGTMIVSLVMNIIEEYSGHALLKE